MRILAKLTAAVEKRETELAGNESRETGKTRILRMPTFNQTNNYVCVTPKDPVPQQFQVADFLPPGERDEDELSEYNERQTALVPEDGILRFVLIKREILGDEEWTIPDRKGFSRTVSTITQNAITDPLALDAYAWSDPKRGNIALYTDSCHDIERFREVVHSMDPPHRPATNMRPTSGRVWSRNIR